MTLASQRRRRPTSSCGSRSAACALPSPGAERCEGAAVAVCAGAAVRGSSWCGCTQARRGMVGWVGEWVSGRIGGGARAGQVMATDGERRRPHRAPISQRACCRGRLLIAFHGTWLGRGGQRQAAARGSQRHAIPAAIAPFSSRRVGSVSTEQQRAHWQCRAGEAGGPWHGTTGATPAVSAQWTGSAMDRWT
jgi:hypothetical protein